MIEALQAVPDLLLSRDEPLANWTSMKVGGPADLFLRPRTVEAARQAFALLRSAGVPLLVLGNGSNLLVRDGGFRGAVLQLGLLPESIEARQEGRLYVSAQVLLLRAVTEGHRLGLVGLEWASGIPGSLGGAVTMNAGCHGREMGQHVVSVELVTPAGTLVRWGLDQLAYGYRTSRLRQEHHLILGAELQLVVGDVAEGRRRLRHFLALRRNSQPVGHNAGSMFKNPPGDFAGRLIEAVGGKGRRVGDAEISPVHANFIVNHGAARASDVLALVAWAREAVEQRFGITLELEVEVVGEETQT